MSDCTIIPPNWTEAERLAALWRYDILDTPKEEDFDNIVKLASQICNAPISLISLVDKDRQWFKAAVGLEISETSLDVSVCAHAILQHELFVVPDTTKDPRFANNPLVTGEPHLRFYAGALLETSEGQPVGMMCILDYQPRQLSDREAFTLKTLARQVMSLLELRKALCEKHVSEHRLQLALESSSVIGIWDWDIGNNTVIADARSAKLYNVDAKQAAKGLPFKDYIKTVHPEDLAYVTSAVESALHSQDMFSIEYRLVNPDKSLRWIHMRGRCHHDTLNKPVRFIGVSIDITERKYSEQRLREMTERFSLMVESAKDYAIISIDIHGNIISWNSGAERIFRFTSDEVTGTSVAVIFTPEDRANGIPQKELETAARDGRAEDERWHIRKDGTRFYVSGIMAAVNDEAGKLVGFTKIARDVTGQKEAEEKLIEARNIAESANIAKTEFLANMSHEIRTPMNAVIGLANILSMSQPLTERQREFIDTLQYSAESLLALINDLLDISKIEARTVELEHIPFSLAGIVEEAVGMLQGKAQEKGLAFTMDATFIRGYIYIGDPSRIRQIIINLCSNAIKFTAQGSIHIAILCQDSHLLDVDQVSIVVSDSGIGIAGDKLDSIFEKFVQADPSISRKYGGTGLGLAITKTLSELMGGSVTVRSTLGQGSVFTVSLPLQRGEDDARINAFSTRNYEDNAAKPKYRVLLVEDYAPNVLVAGTFLEQFGYEYEVASNGMEAVEKVKASRYMCALMDVQMNGMDGLHATQHIRAYEQQHGKAPLPIIGMTAHAFSDDRERCIAAGMNDYISKPFNPEELQEKLQALQCEAVE